MSGKPTEEGWFWEWRAFGGVPDAVVERVRTRELRGEPDVANDDLYLVSPLTDQNVKLRGDGAALKLKPLLAALDGGFELYEETGRLVFAMPAPRRAALMAASLLGVEVDAAASLGRDELLAAFAARAPAVRAVRVRKRRTQYAAGEGWIEVAELEFPAAAVRSVAIQSPRLGETRRVRDEIDPEHALAPMNYVAACRRWS